MYNAAIELRSHIKADFPICRDNLSAIVERFDIDIANPVRANREINEGFHLVYQIHAPTPELIHDIIEEVRQSSSPIFRHATFIRIQVPA